MREEAAGALGRYAERGIVDGDSVFSLVGLLRDRDESVRLAAEQALDRVSEYFGVSREELVRDPSLVAGRR